MTDDTGRGTVEVGSVGMAHVMRALNAVGMRGRAIAIMVAADVADHMRANGDRRNACTSKVSLSPKWWAAQSGFSRRKIRETIGDMARAGVLVGVFKWVGAGQRVVRVMIHTTAECAGAGLNTVDSGGVCSVCHASLRSRDDVRFPMGMTGWRNMERIGSGGTQWSPKGDAAVPPLLGDAAVPPSVGGRSGPPSTFQRNNGETTRESADALGARRTNRGESGKGKGNRSAENLHAPLPLFKADNLRQPEPEPEPEFLELLSGVRELAEDELKRLAAFAARDVLRHDEGKIDAMRGGTGAAWARERRRLGERKAAYQSELSRRNSNPEADRAERMAIAAQSGFSQ